MIFNRVSVVRFKGKYNVHLDILTEQYCSDKGDVRGWRTRSLKRELDNLAVEEEGAWVEASYMSLSRTWDNTL